MCMKATTLPRALENRFRPRDERKACGAQAGVNFVGEKGTEVQRGVGQKIARRPGTVMV